MGLEFHPTALLWGLAYLRARLLTMSEHDTISLHRWRHAQRSQLRHQRSKAARISASGRADALAWSASRHSRAVHAKLVATGRVAPSPTVAEIGSGAHGLVWRWPEGRCIAIDPLAGFYWRAFADLQQSGTEELLPVAARGEELPLRTDSVDLLLSDNVLDHAQEPERFLRECRRVLKASGTLYMTVDVHHPAWNVGARTYNALVDRGVELRLPAFPSHPFHFTRPHVQALLGKAGFRILQQAGGEPASARTERLRRRPSALLKKVFFKNARWELICG